MTAGEPRLVILAAGASTRLGQPKALANLGGRSALTHLLEAGATGEAATLLTGAHHREIAAARPAGCEILENTSWSAGRTGGLALAAAGHPGRDLLVAPIDVPLVPRLVFDLLRRAWALAGAPASGWLAARSPNHGEPWAAARPGHPILIGRELAAQLPQMASDAPLKALRALAEPLWTVDILAPAIHDDLDTPDDLARLRRRLDAAPKG